MSLEGYSEKAKADIATAFIQHMKSYGIVLCQKMLLDEARPLSNEELFKAVGSFKEAE